MYSINKSSNLFLHVFVFLCAIILEPVRCASENSVTEPQKSNYTFLTSMYDSFVTCIGQRDSKDANGSQCFKDKLYRILEQILRDRLENMFSPEEKLELSEYKPVFRKISRILKKDNEGPWLDAKIFNHLKLLLSGSAEDSEGRKKKNKGIGQIVWFSIISGITVMVPLLFKAILAIAAKALIASKIAIILSALLYFNKITQHEHSSLHETTIRRHAI